MSYSNLIYLAVTSLSRAFLAQAPLPRPELISPGSLPQFHGFGLSNLSTELSGPSVPFLYIVRLPLCHGSTQSSPMPAPLRLRLDRSRLTGAPTHTNSGPGSLAHMLSWCKRVPLVVELTCAELQKPCSQTQELACRQGSLARSGFPVLNSRVV